MFAATHAIQRTEAMVFLWLSFYGNIPVRIIVKPVSLVACIYSIIIVHDHLGDVVQDQAQAFSFPVLNLRLQEVSAVVGMNGHRLQE